MALWWTSKVAGEDGDELSGWSVATRSRGSDTVWDKPRDRKRENGVQLTDGVEAELRAAVVQQRLRLSEAQL
jgi:hypothetical protein